ncbi:helix-turn-helix transcriptional regulator [Pseudomonas sp. TH31]|uniref:helix-turn-helix transcriptional regulator n=1 Tax=Pseudomonas sp. TH31 TaxID=2796396 RepID=UPI001914B4D1|nr:LuxR family transcriptional regulator [Pseudomonas sp. TH31]MBK5416198.1 LuxR family transcriptional regulator [Pseudomonas sp. TH31]
MNNRLEFLGLIHSDIDEFFFRAKYELENKLKDFGFYSYAYIATLKNRKVTPVIISNYPASWLSAYKAANYHLIDPVINYGLLNCAPFSWGKLQGLTEGKEFFKLSGRHQISSGTTFILHDSVGLFAALSVCNISNQDEFEQRLVDHAAEIQMALIHFHDCLLSTRTVEELFPESKDDLLSEKEMLVLKCVVRGKAYREVAAICAISERTVKFHMSNISRKLQVCNAKQAVFEAKRRGII